MGCECVWGQSAIQTVFVRTKQIPMEKSANHCKSKSHPSSRLSVTLILHCGRFIIAVESVKTLCDYVDLVFRNTCYVIYWMTDWEHTWRLTAMSSLRTMLASANGFQSIQERSRESNDLICFPQISMKFTNQCSSIWYCIGPYNTGLGTDRRRRAFCDHIWT